jgi:hypothetical protein
MHWATKAPQPQLTSAEHHEPGGSQYKERTGTTASIATGHSSGERSPSPRQASPYNKAQHIDLTVSAKGDHFFLLFWLCF